MKRRMCETCPFNKKSKHYNTSESNLFHEQLKQFTEFCKNQDEFEIEKLKSEFINMGIEKVTKLNVVDSNNVQYPHGCHEVKQSNYYFEKNKHLQCVGHRKHIQKNEEIENSIAVRYI